MFSIQEIQNINQTRPQPCVEVHILPFKYAHTIKAIAYIDTRAQRTIMDLDILPVEAWKKEAAYFIATEDKVFKT